MFNREQRQWKKAADDAISPVHFELERLRLVDALVPRFDSSSPATSSLLARETMAARVQLYLKDSVIRAFLAGNYLDALYDGANASEYGDALILTKRADWTRSYYFSILEHPEVMGYPNSEESPFSEMQAIRRLRDDVGTAILRVATAERVMAA